MPKHKYAILLAGGQGSRFWPQSRTLEPKQFLCLHKDRSLFEETVNRIKPLIPAQNIFVVTSELYRTQILGFIGPLKIPLANIIFEPEPKNTAPSVGIAVRLISLLDPLAKACVLPCDHMIKNERKLHSLLSKAMAACENSLIIFGVPPTRASTGYGYIKIDETGLKGAVMGIYPVRRFIEKPNLQTAQRFLKEGRYFWNSGISVGSCQIFLEEIKKYSPHIYNQLLKVSNPEDIKSIWNKMEAISFDCGVLEKSRRILMLKAQGLSWSDLGSWQAWDEILEKDKDGNILNADIINLGSKDITVLGDNRLIATIGLKDVILVDTADALLVTKKDKSEEVKKIVTMLKSQNRQEHYTHKTVKRPWGAYTALDVGLGFKVKLVEIKPKHSLSLQFHNRRSEHWIVVEGTAKIIKGKKSYLLSANESTYIPSGCVHRLMNPSDTALKIIEVQTGVYLEEDDVVRIKDDFGRT